MTATAATAVSLIGFGGLDGPWGLAILGSEPLLVLSPAHPGGAPGVIRLAAASPDSLAGEAIELRVDRGPAPMCRLEGELAGFGEVSLIGVEAALALGEVTSLDALRLVLMWFAPDDGFALSAARPRGADGHENDAVSVAAYEPAGPVEIDEGRLSTTYERDGQPRRMSVESWPQDEENAFPHRSAGEIAGPAATVELDGVSLTVHPMRCHRAGRDGGGLYVLARGR